MFRFFKYLSYVMITRKAIQSARTVFGEGGLAAQILDAISFNLKAMARSAALAAGGACLIGIGALYILFHTAAEYDQQGYISFNAQKGVCLAFIMSGLAMIAMSRKAMQPLRPLEPARLPEMPTAPSPALQNLGVPSQRAVQIQGLFQMMNKEAAKFIEQTTRPATQQPPPRPPTNERALV